MTSKAPSNLVSYDNVKLDGNKRHRYFLRLERGDSLEHSSWQPWAARGHPDSPRKEVGGTLGPDNIGIGTNPPTTNP